MELPLVAAQISFLAEAFATNGTMVRFLMEMSPHVVVKCEDIAEGLAADTTLLLELAHEQPVVLVFLFVPLQIKKQKISASWDWLRIVKEPGIEVRPVNHQYHFICMYLILAHEFLREVLKSLAVQHLSDELKIGQQALFVVQRPLHPAQVLLL